MATEPQRFDVPPGEGITPDPGVYAFGLDEDKRRALNFAPGLMSYTRLTRHDDPDKKISAFVAGVGNLVSDTLLFGREACVGRYHFHGEQVPFNTKAGKAWRDQWKADNPGMVLIRPKEREEAEHLIEVAYANPDCKAVLDAPGYCEAGVVADVGGVRFRSWLDKLTRKAVIDIKTTRAATEKEFLVSAVKYKYNVQAGLYLDQCEQIGLGQLKFAWLCVSKTSGRAWLTELPGWMYHAGAQWRDSMIRSYRREGALKSQLSEALASQNTGDTD